MRLAMIARSSAGNGYNSSKTNAALVPVVKKLYALIGELEAVQATDVELGLRQPKAARRTGKASSARVERITSPEQVYRALETLSARGIAPTRRTGVRRRRANSPRVMDWTDDSSSALGLTHRAGSAEIRHEQRTCQDTACGRCGRSTRRQALDGEGDLRAGARYDGEGIPDPEARDTRYDPRMTGTVAEALATLSHDPDSCPGCSRCDEIDGRTLQREVHVQAHGGGGSGTHSDKRATGATCRVEGCGMSLCEHLRGGRARADGRSHALTVKVRAAARAALQSSAGASLIDELGFAIAGGLTLADARSRLGIDGGGSAA